MSLNEMLIYSEQMTKPLIAASSATMSVNSTTKSFSVSDRQSNSPKCFPNSMHHVPLGKYHGKSWSEILDFDRILKQIRLSEKCFLNDKEYNGSCHGHNNNNYRTASGNLPLHDKPRKPQIRQVQRLSGTDMHYYGIVPKQSALDVIVCNLCTGTYTKKGFNNHMLLQHPTVWANISNKVLLSSSEKGSLGNDSCQDGSKEDALSVNADLLGSPSDLSGMLSNSSNASSSSASTVSSALTYIPGSGFNSRQKSTSNTASDSGKRVSGSRSRSKSKHHSSSTTSKLNVDESNSCRPTSTKKSSKKHSSSSSKNINRNSINAPSLISNNKDISHTKDANVVDKLVICNKKQMDASRPSKTSIPPSYSTSSTSANSSYSLPSTPKMLLTNLQDTTTVNQVPSLSSIAEYPYSPLDTNHKETNVKNGNSKLSTSTNETESTTKRKHNKLAHAFVGHDNTQEFSSGKKSKIAPSVIANNGISKSQHLHPYKMQTKSVEPSTGPFITDEKITNGNGSNQIEFTVLNTNQEPEQSSVNGEGQLLPNTSDDSAMLKHVLEEFNRLDSKVINEILNAEAELNFNQNDLNHDISNASNNQLQQQSTMYLDQPANKRMRFDDTCTMQQQITPTATSQDGSIAFTIYQPQSQYRNQEYIEYNNSEIANTIQLDSQYHTPIDSLQLQNLLYQQQQQQQRQQHEQKQQLQNQLNATVYGNVIEEVNMLNVEQMPEVLMAPKNLLGTNPTDQLLVKCKQEGYNTLSDGTQQYQIFNVPSLMEDVDNQTMAHIVERQYVLPENDEEQFIYEISANNPVTAMSQEHQQEVLAEFLNQAATSYEQNQMEKTVHQSEYSTANFDYDKLFDFDFSLVDAVTFTNDASKRNNPAATISNNNLYSNVLIKEENDQQEVSSKHKEDCYYNVLFYAGIPRPLSINSFGIVNLPQRVATTFRKHLLNTRKSNNSLLSLGSASRNGMTTQNSSSSSTSALTHRFSASKQLPNYFTALAAVNNGRVSAQGNEFSIGSITITNASPNVNQQQIPHSAAFQQSKQQNTGYSSVDIACNWTNGANGTMPSVPTISRTRNKIGISTANSGSAFVNMSSSNLRSKYFSGFGTSANTSQATVAAIGPNNSKSIIVNNAVTSNLDRNNKVIKRNIFNKNLPSQMTTNAQFTSKQLGNLLNRKLVTSTKSASITNADPHLQINTNRINHFYEHRRKLLNMSRNNDNGFIKKNAKSLPLLTFSHKPQKLLRQQLTHNLPNCGKTSTSTISNVLSNDMMQVLV